MNTDDQRKRVLFDTNFFISFLLHPENPGSSISQILALAIGGAFQLIVPDDVIVELRKSIARKSYLNRAVGQDDLEALVRIIESLRLSTPTVPGPYPRIVRDRGDDYLLAHARVLDVDILVTDDKDLLVLSEHLDRPRIVNAREFLEFMQSEH